MKDEWFTHGWHGWHGWGRFDHRERKEHREEGPMNCPKCESPRTMVDATRYCQPEDGPHQTIRLRRCLTCRCRFRTVEEWLPGAFPWKRGRQPPEKL